MELTEVLWGPHSHGATLHINKIPSLSPSVLFIDVETDEKDNFVGIGLTQDGKDIYYYNDIQTVKGLFLNYPLHLAGHNLKFDAKLLVKWGIKIHPDQLQDDTILMSYAINTTKASHSLKDLGKELGYTWPKYSDLVGKGKKKLTLDKHDTIITASYCAMDVLVTHALWKHFNKTFDISARRIYTNIEMPLMRILFEMELQGVLIDVDRLKSLDKELKDKLDGLTSDLIRLAGKEINPNSNKQTAEILESRGIVLPLTEKGNKKVDKFVLEQNQDDDFVSKLLAYNKIEKLYSTYTQGALKRETLPRLFTTYNQVTTKAGTTDERGISTGRLSSSNPNLQQIPTRTDEGRLLRELFIPKEGHTLIDADYSQIEPRLVAHFSKDPFLLKVFRTGIDLYDALVEGTGRSRNDGKTFMLAMLYGAQPKKLARGFKCTESEAEALYKKFISKMPGVIAWIERVKYAARAKKGIFTIMQGWRPIPGINSASKWERMHWERVAVNYTIQGSAAEVMKMAMIELRKVGYLPLLTVHDELLFEVESAHDENALDLMRLANEQEKIKRAMESVIKLDVPLIAEVGIGKTWKEAKGD